MRSSTMQIYNYHPVTGEYKSTSEADVSPLSPNEFLIPKFSTSISPPESIEGKTAVFDGNGWHLVDDFRGEKYWNEDGVECIVSEIGETIPDNATDTEPQNNQLKKQILTLERQQTSRRMREAILGIDGGWLLDIESQIVALREQLV